MSQIIITEPYKPQQTQYLKIQPSSQRGRLLMALAAEYGCPWQDVARFAIDEFLKKNPPKKQG